MGKILVVLGVLVLLSCFLASTIPVNAGDSNAGAAVYTKRCASCHGADGKGNEKMAKSLKKDLNLLRSDIVSKDDATLIKSVADGKPPMIAFGKVLSAAEIENVIAYVRKLQK